MVNNYIPKQGDIVVTNFDPQKGHEQAGLRPAVTLSSNKYNEKTGLAVFCPITSQIKGYPFEVALPKNAKTKGVILSDQIKTFDFKSRGVKYVEKIDDATLKDVLLRINLLISVEN